MKMYNIKGLDVFITKSKYNGSYFVKCSNGSTRVFMDYNIKEILEIIEQDNFPTNKIKGK